MGLGLPPIGVLHTPPTVGRELWHVAEGSSLDQVLDQIRRMHQQGRTVVGISPDDIVRWAHASRRPRSEILHRCSQAGLSWLSPGPIPLLVDALKTLLAPQAVLQQDWQDVYLRAYDVGLPAAAGVFLGDVVDVHHLEYHFAQLQALPGLVHLEVVVATPRNFPTLRPPFIPAVVQAIAMAHAHLPQLPIYVMGDEWSADARALLTAQGIAAMMNPISEASHD